MTSILLERVEFGVVTVFSKTASILPTCPKTINQALNQALKWAGI